MNDNEKAYFDTLANSLAGTIAAVQEITKFTTNKDVVGAYAESLVYQFIERIVHPLRISTGTVISPATFGNPKATPQFDLIIWDPNPIPPLMAENRFALVPKNSVLSLLEIKKTDYNEGLDNIEETSAVAKANLPPNTEHLF